MPQKVLITASTFAHIRSFHLPYIARFHEAGLEVHVACGGTPVEIPEADRLLALPLQKKMQSPDNLNAAAILRRAMEQERYALICTHTSLAAFFTRVAAAGCHPRPPLVYMCHGYLFDDDSSALRRSVLLAAERMTARQTDLLLTMNAYDDRLARQYRLGGRIRKVPGVGVDFDRLAPERPDAAPSLRAKLGIPEDAFVLFYAAEFSPRKSQAFLIQAMRELPEQVVLVLAGTGALLDDCKAQTAQLDLGRRVYFPGHVSPVGDWYAMADAAVSSSRSEGLPFNIMEAMHAGLPVVASDVKGNADLIIHGRSGLLYPYVNTAAYAAQIRTLLASDTLRQQLGNQARVDVAPYGLEAVLPQVWDCYASLLGLPEAVRG